MTKLIERTRMFAGLALIVMAIVLMTEIRVRSIVKEVVGPVQPIAVFDAIRDTQMLRDERSVYIAADHNGTITGCSSNVTHIIGWLPSDLIGHPVSKIVPSEFQQRHEHAYRNRVNNQLPDKTTLVYGFMEKKEGGQQSVSIIVRGWSTSDGLSFIARITPE